MKFNINYEQVLKKSNVSNIPAKKVVSPFRTKQPSVNNSRRFSKERDQSSVHSPRTTKNTIGNKTKKVNSTRGGDQQSSFLSKANSKSLNSSSMLHNNNQ